MESNKHSIGEIESSGISRRNELKLKIKYLNPFVRKENFWIASSKLKSTIEKYFTLG